MYTWENIATLIKFFGCRCRKIKQFIVTKATKIKHLENNQAALRANFGAVLQFETASHATINRMVCKKSNCCTGILFVAPIKSDYKIAHFFPPHANTKTRGRHWLLPYFCRHDINASDIPPSNSSCQQFKKHDQYLACRNPS